MTSTCRLPSISAVWKPVRAGRRTRRLGGALAAVLGTAAARSEDLSARTQVRLEAAAVGILVNGRHAGSGWVAGDGRDVVTAAHLFWRAVETIEVRFSDGVRAPATLLGSDPAHDLALLRLPETTDARAPLRLRERAPRAGAQLWLMGDPVLRQGLLLSGTLASTAPRTEWNPILHAPTRMLHVSGPGPQGVSGGAWTDDDGRVVGVQSGAITLEGAGTGIAYFAPAGAVRELLRQRGHIVRASLGCALEEIHEQSEEFIRSVPAPRTGLVAVEIRPDSAAARAGLTGTTLLRSLNGVALTTREAAFGILMRLHPGDEVRLTILDLPTAAEREAVVRLDALRMPGGG
jgi:S1-C subfamily serine protease